MTSVLRALGPHSPDDQPTRVEQWAIVLAASTRCPHGTGRSVEEALDCCEHLRGLLIAGDIAAFHSETR